MFRNHRAHLVLLALFFVLSPLLAVIRPQPVAAAGVVTTCTEAALRAALAGGGLVTFSGCGTITLTSQLEITADTIIDGGGVVTLDGGSATRLLVVNSGVELALLNLTLTGGVAPPGTQGGGAILNHGGLTISGSTMSGNSADRGGAIDNHGTLTLTASTLSGNNASGGGALYNYGVLMITAGTLSGNSATGGGAIVSVGTLTIAASTLNGNSASSGGAIISTGNLTLTASTLSGNSAGLGGAIRNVGELTITASTLSNNHNASSGGAINNTGNVTLTASTLSGNSATNGGAIFNRAEGSVTLAASTLSGSNLCAGPAAFTSNGYNVASDNTCNLTATGDLQNTDPLLGALQDNGGRTDTMLPQSGSPAIDRVPVALCATLSAANEGRDQRGASRGSFDGSNCDSGAVESGRVVPAWFLAAIAMPDTILAGQSITFYAVGSGPAGAHLNYSFGCPEGFVRPQPSPQATCSFPRAGDIRVDVTVSNLGPPSTGDTNSVYVTVLDPTPVVTLAPASATVPEGGSYTGTGAFTSAGPGPWKATVDYGDGSAAVDLGAVEPDVPILLSHQYLSAGDYPITLTVCDADVRCDTAQAAVAVTEAQVAVTLTPASATLGEGGSYEGDGDFTSDGPGPFSASVDYGAGPQDLGTVTPDMDIPISHQYLSIGDSIITLEICDTVVNRCGEAQANITVTAVAPSVTIDPLSLYINEGDVFQATGAFTDPGLGPWTATVDYGQGAGPEPLALTPENTFSLSRQYLQQGSFPVSVAVCDAADACGSASVTVRVRNLAPIIHTVTTNRDGSRITIRVVASDPGGDPLSYRFECAGQSIGPQAGPTAVCDFGRQTGQFAALVEVFDENGARAARTVLITIPTYLCVGDRSGVPRFMDNAGDCLRDQQPLVLIEVGSWSFCVGERSGSLRYLFNGHASCRRGELKLTLPEQGPITVCVGERSHAMREIASGGSCLRDELDFRIAHRVS